MLAILIIGCATSNKDIKPLGVGDKTYDFMGVWFSSECVERIVGNESLWMKMKYEFNISEEYIDQRQFYTDNLCSIAKVSRRHAGRQAGPPPKSFLILEELMVSESLFSKSVPGTKLHILFSGPIPRVLDLYVSVKDNVLCASDAITFGSSGTGSSSNANYHVNFSNCIYRSNDLLLMRKLH